PIRIVTPSASTVPSNNSATSGAPGLFQAAGQTSSVPSSGSTPSPTLNQSLASIPPASNNSPAASSSAANARIPEITDLPPASGYTPATFTSAVPQSSVPKPALSPTATPSTANMASTGPSAIQLNSYGYDSQYHWLKGKLEYSQTTHAWRLRYI